jgi:hypothetical protein
MSPPTNNCRYTRTEHHFYAEIITDITTRNSEHKYTVMIIGQHKKLKNQQHGLHYV